MTGLPTMDNELRELPLHVPIVLHNKRCPYCGVALTTDNSTKEHVIGRRFVPRGKLEGQWNLILRACRPCNVRKSDLEDDISAISMQPDMWGRFAVDDEALRKESQRKARNSISRLSKKAVAESRSQLEFKAPFMGQGTMTATFTGPPQAQSERVFELAQMQVAAFFHLITYNREQQTGGYMLGGYFPIMEALRSDWGNPVHRTFMDQVVEWEPRFMGPGADGFFKIIIRRHPTLVCWSWAVEWNHKIRVIGFAGERPAVEEVAKAIPPLQVQSMYEGLRSSFRLRHEVSISDDDDRLFYWPQSDRPDGET